MNGTGKRALRLGMIGSSPGNGHPYSWSAILNGFEPDLMRECPYPAIPEYMLTSPPDRKLDAGAAVEWIWTPDREESARIAATTRIPSVASAPGVLIGKVDAVLLARDDAENHLALARPFLEAGLPVFIDKPLAFDTATAASLFSLERFPGQIFSCSGLRYAREFDPSQPGVRKLGPIRSFRAESVKDWDKYAIHAIDPLLALLGRSDPPGSCRRIGTGDARGIHVAWKGGPQGTITVTGSGEGEIAIELEGREGKARFVFRDTLFAFSGSLRAFLAAVRDPRQAPPRDGILASIRLLEAGR